MAAAVAARSALRSATTSNVSSRPAPSPFRISSQKHLSTRIFRSPVEMDSVSREGKVAYLSSNVKSPSNSKQRKKIDMKPNNSAVGIVEGIEYDANRNCNSRIALVRWERGANQRKPIEEFSMPERRLEFSTITTIRDTCPFSSLPGTEDQIKETSTNDIFTSAFTPRSKGETAYLPSSGFPRIAVVGDCLLRGTPTMFISGFLPRSSKNWVADNRRHKSSLVGTSETTRARTYPKSFCEWLAGIIDGDGSIQVSKKGYTSLEITVGLEDLRLLRYIQHMLGGGIKMRAGAKSYRYRLHNHLGMIKLMNCINGHIRHSARLLQLHRVCQVLEIPVILPVPLDAQSNWFAGFFDADGTITIDMKHGLPQLSIRVTNKLLQDVESYKVVFGGSLYFDSSQNGYYQWYIQSRTDIIMMLDYFKSNTFRSHKSRRFFLIEEYYSLYDLEAFKHDSIHHKAWLAFLGKWNK